MSSSCWHYRDKKRPAYARDRQWWPVEGVKRIPSAFRRTRQLQQRCIYCNIET